MRKLILLFNHELTEAQKLDAKNLGVENEYSLGVEEFVYLPEDLQKIWSNIPPEIEDVKDVLEPIEDWVDEVADEGDYVLIQGDFGAVYYMIRYCKSYHFVTPVYATTKREFTEVQ